MKKLLNKRGSVLFLVIVVMAILLVAASATYYVIRNQHASVNVHYNSEQSYQTAYSVSTSLKEYFTDYIGKINSKEASYSGSLFEKMWTTPTLDSKDVDLQKYGLGEFDVTITQKDFKVDAEGNETKTFEVTVKASSNGETTTLTQVWTITLSAEETGYFTRFLTSTGEDGLGRDVHLGAHRIYGDAYFENAYTSMENVFMQRSFYANGTLSDQGISFDNGKDLEMAVAGNYYAETAGYGSMTIGKLYVGGNFYNGYINPRYSGKAINVDAAFIVGDFHYNANSGASTGTFFVQKDFYLNGMMGEDTVIYVGGDLYISDKGEQWNCGKIYVAGNVYLYAQASGGSINGNLTQVYCAGEEKVINSSGMLEDAPNESGNWSFRRWKDEKVTYQSDITALIETEMNKKSTALHDPKSDKKDVFSDWSDVARYISNSTAKGTYVDWNAEIYFGKRYGDAPVIDFDKNVSDYPYPSWENEYTVPDQVDLKDTENNTVNGYISKANIWSYGGGSFLAVIRESFVWRTCHQDQSLVVIDTSELSDDEEALYVYLDCSDQDVFQFFTSSNGNNIVVMGEKPVVFVLPKGKDIKILTQLFIGHYELARYFAKYIPDGAKDANSVQDLRGLNIFGGAAARKDNIDEIFTFDEATGITSLKQSMFSGPVHNNIFLVSTGYGNYLDLNGQFVFCGYIYTPHMLFNFYENTGSLSFIGGLIVGSYVYNSTESNLVFINPNPLEIVSELMSKANEGLGIPSFTPGNSETKATIEFEGYK